MTSGVIIHDSVMEVFNEIKAYKTATQDDVKKHKKAVFLCFNDDCSEIQLEENKQILVGDIRNSVDDPFLMFIHLPPPNDCRHSLYPLFVSWCPDSATTKLKMMYSNGKNSIKKMFPGIQHDCLCVTSH
uniref:ADF-H domain-containing protein n=1 Tax=Eptatretus burgeri TaxID=7764 RepID=A0A8C4WTB0_EPTBU